MTKKQRREHKLGNQLRRLKLLGLYYKIKPSSKSWLSGPGTGQAGKLTTEAARLLNLSDAARNRLCV